MEREALLVRSVFASDPPVEGDVLYIQLKQLFKILIDGEGSTTFK